jgi:hypothetical protein
VSRLKQDPLVMMFRMSHVRMWTALILSRSTTMKIGNWLLVVTLAVVAHPALAQPQTSVDVTKGMGNASVTATSTVTATIVAIAPATRTVTLKERSGRVFEVEVGEEARNFDQLKVGDIVTMEYRKAMSLSLEKTNGPRSATQQLVEKRAAPGEKPGGTIGREVTVIADVVSVNAKAKSVTLKGPQGNTVDVVVEDPEQMKNIRKGDQVKVVYTEAIAISVSPGASQ